MKSAPFAVSPLVLLLGFNHAPQPCAKLPSEHRFACDSLALYSRFKDLPEHNDRTPLRYPHTIAVTTATTTASVIDLGDPIFARGRKA